MKKGSVILLLGVLASAALLIAGCGGGDDETASLTRTEFVQQANAICKESEQERSTLFRQAAAGLNPANATKQDREELISNVLLAPYERATEQIDSLGAPSGDEERVEALIDAREGAIPKVKAKPRQALNSTIGFAEANKLADEYGLTGCVV